VCQPTGVRFLGGVVELHPSIPHYATVPFYRFLLQGELPRTLMWTWSKDTVARF
jgi:hypothetical protein